MRGKAGPAEAGIYCVPTARASWGRPFVDSAGHFSQGPEDTVRTRPATLGPAKTHAGFPGFPAGCQGRPGTQAATEYAGPLVRKLVIIKNFKMVTGQGSPKLGALWKEEPWPLHGSHTREAGLVPKPSQQACAIRSQPSLLTWTGSFVSKDPTVVEPIPAQGRRRHCAVWRP